MKFSEIQVGNYFMFNGNKYIKNSKCTAKLLEFNRVLYFTSNEVIHVVLSEVNWYGNI